MRIVFLLPILAGFLQAAAQFPYHPLQTQSLSPKLIQNKGIRSVLVFEKDGEQRTLREFAVFNEKGLLITSGEKEVREEGDTVLKTATHFTYNTKGQLTRTLMIDSEEELRIPATYTYNTAGKLVTHKSAEVDPPTTTYSYLPDGKLKSKLVTQRMTDEQNKVRDVKTYAHTFRYDAKGRLAEEWMYFLQPDPKMTAPAYKLTWTYNDKDQVTVLRRVNAVGTEMWRSTYDYDTDGLLTKCHFKADLTTAVYVYEYR